MKDPVVLKLACRGLTMCYSVLKLYGKSCSTISTELYQKEVSYLEALLPTVRLLHTLHNKVMCRSLSRGGGHLLSLMLQW